MRGITLLLVAATLLFVCNPLFAYRNVIDLGSVGGLSSWAQSINDNGQVVGYSTSSYNTQASLFDQTGKPAKSLWGNDSEAYSINNSGKIVGRGIFLSAWPNPNQYDQASLFDSQNTNNNRRLGSLGGTLSAARSINNNNQIVGWAYNASEMPRACLFDSSGNGANKDLRTFGGSYSYAFSINDSGIIVGTAYLNDSDPPYMEHACRFDASGNGANIDLGTLGGDYSCAFSINNSNQIVGWAAGSGNSYAHACLFDLTGNGANLDLGTLEGRSEALFINDSGQIVGWSSDSINGKHACLFDSSGNGNNIDLNSLLALIQDGCFLRQPVLITMDGLSEMEDTMVIIVPFYLRPSRRHCCYWDLE